MKLRPLTLYEKYHIVKLLREELYLNQSFAAPPGAMKKGRRYNEYEREHEKYIAIQKLLLAVESIEV